MHLVWNTLPIAVVFWTCVGIITAEQYFSVLPNDTTVVEGDTVTFNCVAHNVTQYLAWSKGHELLIYHNEALGSGVSPSLGARLSITGNSTIGEYNLQIANVTEEDEGEYMCILYNPQAVFSPHSTLTVLVPPSEQFPLCSVEPLDTNLTEGTNITLLCRSEEGKPQVELEWENITKSENNTIVSTNSSVTAAVQWTLSRNDNGKQFKCKLRSAVLDSPRTCQVRPLNVWYRPTVTLEPSTVNASYGSEINFTYSFDANPEPYTVTWYINEDRVDDRNFTRINNTINYRLRPVSEQQNITNVTCVVHNIVGSDSASAIIYIIVHDSIDGTIDINEQPVHTQKHSYHELTATLAAVGVAGFVIISVLSVLAIQGIGRRCKQEPRRGQKPGIISDYDGFKFYDFRAVKSGTDNPSQDKYELTENVSDLNSANNDDVVIQTSLEDDFGYDTLNEIGNVIIESVKRDKSGSKKEKEVKPNILLDHGASFTNILADQICTHGSLSSFNKNLENDGNEFELGVIEITDSEDERSDGDGASAESVSNTPQVAPIREPHYFVLEKNAQEDAPVATVSDEGTMATDEDLPVSPDVHHYETIADTWKGSHSDSGDDGGETPVSVHYASATVSDFDDVAPEIPPRAFTSASAPPIADTDKSDRDSVSSVESTDIQDALRGICETMSELTAERQTHLPGDDPSNSPSVCSDINHIIDHDFDFLRLHETDLGDRSANCDDINDNNHDYDTVPDENDDDIVTPTDGVYDNRSTSNTNTPTSSLTGSLSDTDSIHSTGDNDDNTEISPEINQPTVDDGGGTDNDILKSDIICTDVSIDKTPENALVC